MKTRKHSRQREAILNKIRSTTSHPTADWIFQELREEWPSLSLGTVYRNLVLFRDEGSIISVCNVNGQERYDGNVAPHGHFVCQQCMAVIDIDMDIQPCFTIDPENIRGCQVERVNLTAYGACRTCLKKEGPKPTS